MSLLRLLNQGQKVPPALHHLWLEPRQVHRLPLFQPQVQELKVGLEFAMPKTPPPTSRPAKKAKDGRRSRQRSRSSSSTRCNSRQRDELRASIPRGVNAADVPVPTLKRGRGRGKVKELTNAPLLIPTVPSHLSSITKPKEGLKVMIPS